MATTSLLFYRELGLGRQLVYPLQAQEAAVQQLAAAAAAASPGKARSSMSLSLLAGRY
jgi:phosphoglycerol transferase MdoB-like AlkP superfamily enzyme